MAKNEFSWPNGCRAALSLTFDDARPSQVTTGLPILDRYGVRGTFYVSFQHLETNHDSWRQAVANGHEIGNHTVSHPCSGNFVWSRGRALEDYTIERIEQDIVEANQRIKSLLDVTPATFAYPCGQTFVGRGEGVRSYVPVAARHFTAARAFHAECVNDPTYCDLAQVQGIDADDATEADLLSWIQRAVESGGWAVFVGHDVGQGPSQIINDRVLETVCRYVQEPANGVWVDTVANVAAHINASRQS
jgi:peptidoglycan/xylan/chitin deacetylase (PgdA/CDA1 family)